MKLKIIYKKNRKFTNIWRLNDMLLNNESMKERNQDYISPNENRTYKTYGVQQKQI